MYIVNFAAIVVNILSIILMLIGLFYNFEQPKVKAVFGYSIAGSLLMYIVILSFVAAYRLTINQYLYSLILILCVVSPFVIGKLVKYETLKKYTVIQIMCFAVSLAVLLIK